LIVTAPVKPAGAIKVCFIAPDLGNGGAQKQLIELVAGLGRPEFDVVVINLFAQYTSDRLKQLGVRIVDLEYRGRRDVTKVFRINRIIAGEKPDILHCVLTSANFYGLLASIGTGVPVRIAGERSLGTRFEGIRRAAYPKILSLADAIVTNSRRNKEWMEQTYKRAPETVQVIHNGCKLPAASPAAVLEEKRRALGIGADEFVIATVTHLTPEKDVECLVRAAARLAARRLAFRLVVAGEGPRVGSVREMIAASKLESRVLLTGHVPHPEALVIAQSCDAFALTSKFEGMPNALMEAMAFARPCVASNVGGIPELVDHGVTGLRFESGDDSALADHLAELMADPELRRRLGQNAQARIAAEFSMEQMVRQHEELYRSLAGRPASGGRIEQRLAG
jgi:glycosyltransferase involved in cell wall biosynthesis